MSAGKTRASAAAAPSTELVLEVWREACRHIRLEESIERIAERLDAECPLGALFVRRVDVQRSALETIAVADKRARRRAPATRTTLSDEELEQALMWIARGDIEQVAGESARRRGSASSPGVMNRILPEGTKEAALVGALKTLDGAPGVLVMIGADGHELDERSPALMRAILEPFAVALDNDRRLAELQALREAAEAERRLLLTRLGGEDMADVVVGVQSGLREVTERVALVAPSDVPVLLVGETGSGKEVVARAIHRSSRRGEGPFLRVNCGAIPSELVDSELFGHERGSFTGAESTRQGWFERAHGGTLFLDEVGELAPAAQVRLLRVLQDGTFERVGGQRTLHVDVRVVAATHRDLQAMTNDGRFRLDLWYRIAVFPIRVPPLRERLGDIPALATHFALKAARRFGTSPLAPSPADLSLLVSYEWPGNVRELSSVVERAVILGNGQSLEVEKALGIGSLSPGTVRASTPEAPPVPHEAKSDELSLDDAMADHIRAALRRCRGRIEGPFGAAAALNVNPHTLRSRMRKLRIDWKAFRGKK